jgi:hypothetical protein
MKMSEGSAKVIVDPTDRNQIVTTSKTKTASHASERERSMRQVWALLQDPYSVRHKVLFVCSQLCYIRIMSSSTPLKKQADLSFR